MRDLERLGKLIKAVHEKCKLSLIRFTKTECAEPNRLFINPVFTPYQRFARVALVSSTYSKTNKISVLRWTYSSLPDWWRKGGEKGGKEAREELSFDHSQGLA